MQGSALVNQPLTIAHAGGSDLAPANTLGAFRWAHGAFDDVWVDCDVRFAGDGELVVIHDDILDRTTSCTGAVSDRTCDELRECNAAAGFPHWGHEPVPTAREMFTEASASGWRVVVEAKNIPGERTFDKTGERHAEALIALAAETKLPFDRLLVMCFWPPTLDQIKSREPRISVGLLTAPKLPDGSPGPTALENVQGCLERGYEVAAPEHTTPDLAEGVEHAHRNGVSVQVWTPNTVQEIEQAIAKGVDTIVSDRPDLVRVALNS
jgi:glycerophosphoryl diester phosphodiesterase